VTAVDRPVVNPALRVSPRFRRFWVARLLSHTAQNAILLGLLVTVVNRTGSTIHSSLLVLTFVLPSAVLGLAGGIVVDRLPKREMLVTTGLFRTALCLLFLHSDGAVVPIYAANLGVSIITQFASPAEAAALPALVPEGQLVAATAALNLEFVIAQLLGTVLLAPILVKTVGLRPLFILTAACFFLASVLYARLTGIDRHEERYLSRSEPASMPGRAFGLTTAAIETWRLIRTDRGVRMSVVLQTLVATTVVVLVSVVPIYTRRVLSLPAEYSVAVFSPAVAGMFLSVRIVPVLARRFSKPRLVIAGFATFVGLLIVLGLSRELSLLLIRYGPSGRTFWSAIHLRVAICAVLAGPLGFAYGVVIVVARAILYERVPLAMQGRVFAFQGVAGSVASILPLVLVGVLAYWIGPRSVLILVAVVNALAAGYVLRFAPAADVPPASSSRAPLTESS
jgi:MFS family permease